MQAVDKLRKLLQPVARRAPRFPNCILEANGEFGMQTMRELTLSSLNECFFRLKT
jgi:hypothetical protein